KDFQPSGSVTLAYTFDREDKGLRHLVIQPENANAIVDEFRYPVERVTGLIEFTGRLDQEDHIHVQLIGHAGERPVFVKGDVDGERPKHTVKIDVWGKDLVLDQKLERAIPRPYDRVVRSFNATGKGDFQASI